MEYPPSELSAWMEETSPETEGERLILEATDLIIRLADQQGVSRKELADRLGKTKGHVSQLLTGERNMTMRTFAELLYALGHRAKMDAVPLGSEELDPRSVGGDYEEGGWPSLSHRVSRQVLAYSAAMNAVLQARGAHLPSGPSRWPADLITRAGGVGDDDEGVSSKAWHVEFKTNTSGTPLTGITEEADVLSDDYALAS